KGKIDVQHVPQSGARIAQAQSEAYVLEQARIAVADHAGAPGPAYVREHGAAHAHQAERKPVGENSLLHGEEGSRGARLEAQGITAQAVVAAEKQLHVGAR